MPKRSENRAWLFPVVLLLVAGSGMAFCQDFEAIRVTTANVGGSVYMLTGAGGNIGACVGPDGILLIDSQFPQLHEKIAAALRAIAPGPVRLLFNTNWHYDHVSGNELFAREGALIAAHEVARERMGSEQAFAGFAAKNPVFPAAARPLLTLADALTLHVNGDVVQVKHVAGAHSDADLLFRFTRANVIHAGDLLFSGMYPYIDVTHGGTLDGMIAAADEILGMCDAGTRLIPGHGPAMTRADVVVFRGMLVTVRDRVVAMARAGRSVEEIVAAKPTADLDGQWGRGADMFVRLACAGMVAK